MWCHQCKQKHDDVIICSRQCSKKYCSRCLLRHYDMNIDDIEPETWDCYYCLKSCKCAFCKKTKNGTMKDGVLKQPKKVAASKRKLKKTSPSRSPRPTKAAAISKPMALCSMAPAVIARTFSPSSGDQFFVKKADNAPPSWCSSSAVPADLLPSFTSSNLKITLKRSDFSHSLTIVQQQQHLLQQQNQQQQLNYQLLLQHQQLSTNSYHVSSKGPSYASLVTPPLQRSGKRRREGSSAESPASKRARRSPPVKNARLNMVAASPHRTGTRALPRVTIVDLMKEGMLKEGDQFVFKNFKEFPATLLADGSIRSAENTMLNSLSHFAKVAALRAGIGSESSLYNGWKTVLCRGVPLVKIRENYHALYHSDSITAADPSAESPASTTTAYPPSPVHLSSSQRSRTRSATNLSLLTISTNSASGPSSSPTHSSSSSSGNVFPTSNPSSETEAVYSGFGNVFTATLLGDNDSTHQEDWATTIPTPTPSPRFFSPLNGKGTRPSFALSRMQSPRDTPISPFLPNRDAFFGFAQEWDTMSNAPHTLPHLDDIHEYEREHPFL
eukprot:TRINITY_DN712_c0_g4_i1.p1 TRINITY_DN712_c0_g4~~TRINITY_DN712_c0_g4_i1.p1  ORF type:complete len:555 (+),score=110.33 TRINITY_DN712_c0_g4_i1:188-1852(+)